MSKMLRVGLLIVLLMTVAWPMTVAKADGPCGDPECGIQNRDPGTGPPCQQMECHTYYTYDSNGSPVYLYTECLCR